MCPVHWVTVYHLGLRADRGLGSCGSRFIHVYRVYVLQYVHMYMYIHTCFTPLCLLLGLLRTALLGPGTGGRGESWTPTTAQRGRYVYVIKYM